MVHMGWIGLDIDGTLTNDKYSIPKEVALYLKELHEQGWKIVVSTGRTAAFAKKALESFHFPFLFSAQNGSLVLEMPSGKILLQRNLDAKALNALESVYKDIEGDFLIYSGFDHGDFCYWRSLNLNQEQKVYIENLKNRQVEDWHLVTSFDPNHLPSFPMAKCFGSKSMLQKVQEKLELTGLFDQAIIRDPFHDTYYLLLVTAKGVSKGSTLKMIMEQQGAGPYCICAGDDENDRSLLSVADFKIVIDTAPESLKEIADFIAKPPRELGIIEALEFATKGCAK